MTERISGLIRQRRVVAPGLVALTLAVPALLLGGAHLERRGEDFSGVNTFRSPPR